MGGKRDDALLRGYVDRRTVEDNVRALGELAVQRVADGFTPHLLTLMFAPLPGGLLPSSRAWLAPRDDLYRRFVPHVVRRPRSPRAVGALPI